MQVTLKLYAQLGQYLPDNRQANEAAVDIADTKTVQGLLNDYNVPPEMCHLVLINGAYVEPSQRDSRLMEEGDHLAVWPPVAGG